MWIFNLIEYVKFLNKYKVNGTLELNARQIQVCYFPQRFFLFISILSKTHLLTKYIDNKGKSTERGKAKINIERRGYIIIYLQFV